MTVYVDEKGRIGAEGGVDRQRKRPGLQPRPKSGAPQAFGSRRGTELNLNALSIGQILFSVKDGSTHMMEADMAKTRDTYKYQFKVGNKIVHGGITDDLDRRESEHQQKWPKGHIKQVGRQTTEDAARDWEKDKGYT